MSWLPAYSKLDNRQRVFIEGHLLSQNDTANYWIQGYPGTGKSVVLIHGLMLYRQKHPNERIALVLYTLSMIELMTVGIPKEIRDTISIIPALDFVNQNKSYDIIFADEVQDFQQTVINAMLFRAKRVILSGDPNQSIFQNACDPGYITLKLKPAIYFLTAIHRSHKNAMLLASCFYEDTSLPGRAQFTADAVTDITIRSYRSYPEEAADVWKSAKEYARNGHETAILVPNHYEMLRTLALVLKIHEAPAWYAKKVPPNNSYDYKSFNAHAAKYRVPAQVIGNGCGSLQDVYNRQLISFLTYHSSKGLDFDILFIPFLNEKITLWRNDERMAKALFLTAITRSRKFLCLSHYGTRHPYINVIPHELLKKQQFTKEQNIAEPKIEPKSDEEFYF